MIGNDHFALFSGTVCKDIYGFFLADLFLAELDAVI